MLEEMIPIIKEQVEMGYASTLVTKEGTMNKKEEDIMNFEFSGQEVQGSTPSTEEVTVTLKLPIQEEQGTTVTPMYSSKDEYKIATTLRKEMNLG